MPPNSLCRCGMVPSYIYGTFVDIYIYICKSFYILILDITDHYGTFVDIYIYIYICKSFYILILDITDHYGSRVGAYQGCQADC